MRSAARAVRLVWSIREGNRVGFWSPVVFQCLPDALLARAQTNRVHSQFHVGSPSTKGCRHGEQVSDQFGLPVCVGFVEYVLQMGANSR